MKEAEVAANECTVVIIARKLGGEIKIVSIGDAKVLGSAGTGGTKGEDDAGSGLVVDGAVDAGMWGSLTGTTEGS